MDRSGFSGDEVWGVFAIGALRAGDIEGAVAILSHARIGYLAGFLLRLAFVAPRVAVRTAWCWWSRLDGSDWGSGDTAWS